MNSRGDRNCEWAGRSAVISCSNTAPDTSSIARTQTEPPLDVAAMKMVRTPPVAMAKLVSHIGQGRCFAGMCAMRRQLAK